MGPGRSLGLRDRRRARNAGDHLGLADRARDRASPPLVTIEPIKANEPPALAFAAAASVTSTIAAKPPAGAGTWVRVDEPANRPETTDNPTTEATGEKSDLALAQARRSLAEGDVKSARETLLNVAAGGNPVVLFTLAETYDPRVLAEWGAADADADLLTARLYYQSAYVGGIARAAERLKKLQHL